MKPTTDVVDVSNQVDNVQSLALVNGDAQKQLTTIPSTNTSGQSKHPGIDPSMQKPICRFYKKGKCKYGISGKSGGECSYRHPKICKKYTNYGKFSDQGCNSSSCDKWHPRICYTGVNTGKCLKKDCRYYHGSFIKRGPLINAEVDYAPRSNTNRSNDDCTQNTPDLGINDTNSIQKSFLEVVQILRQDMERWKGQIIETVQGYPLAQIRASMGIQPHPPQVGGYHALSPSLPHFPPLSQTQTT